MDKAGDEETAHTLTLSRGDLRAARRLLGLLVRGNDESQSELLEPPVRQIVGVSRESLVTRAREEFARRRRRVSFFGASMFGEPAWDMLLALYILDVDGQRQTIGTLLRFSGTSLSTAKRWLDYLALHDLVVREEHPTDRRTAFIRLSTKGREKVDLYYSETSRTGV